MIEKVKLLGHCGNSLILHKNIKIMDENGQELIRFPEFMTSPKSKKLITRSIDDSRFEVQLVDPPLVFSSIPPTSAGARALEDLMKSANFKGLFELEKYSRRGGGQTHDPHSFPKKLLKNKNVFSNVNMMSKKMLENATGQSVEQFWKNVQMFVDSPAMDHMPKGFKPEQVVLLYR